MSLTKRIKKYSLHILLWGPFFVLPIVLFYATVYWPSVSDAVLDYRAHQIPPFYNLPYHVKFDDKTTLAYMKEKRSVVKGNIDNIIMILAKNFGIKAKQQTHLTIKAKLPVSSEIEKLDLAVQDTPPPSGDLALIKAAFSEAAKSWVSMLTVKIVRMDDGTGVQKTMVVDETGHLVPYDKTDRILRWSREIEATAKKHNIDPAIIAAIIEQESGGNPSAGSHAGAQGLMQLMPRTARGLGVDPWDPAQNIEGGTRYFLYQYKRFGNLEQALAAYNAGPGNVLNGNYLYISETQRYIRNVPVLIAKYQRLFAGTQSASTRKQSTAKSKL
ncbi:MAG TPA: lytic transglycosylase domain-containing protein [Bacillota bacterium]|nr:lytic transglycosylase domain-containing protein [Bacillota bacterium]